MDNNDQCIDKIFERVKAASRSTMRLSDEERSAILIKVASAIESNIDALLAANSMDLERMDASSPLYDRLKLTVDRLIGIASDMRNVAKLPSPLGEIIDDRTVASGLRLRRVRVPFGVIGVVYEARPNVTFDVWSLCFKSGNACVLKGGNDARYSNEAAARLIHEVLAENGVNQDVMALLPPTHDATARMLNAVGYIDVCIPRGGRRLIDFVRQNARVPVIETGAGVVSMYVHAGADTEVAARTVCNAKTRRVSVCNALDTLLIDESRLPDLLYIVAGMAGSSVELHADSKAYHALEYKYPAGLLRHAEDDEFDTFSMEWMDYKLGVRTVSGINDALAHIAKYSSGHSEAIITTDTEAAERFRQEVDAACVYVNAPTSFTDGAQFGLGAEIGISTQKLGPRGPMGLRELTTYRWLIDGNGQIRP